jgi:hypothetical protein
MRGKMKHAIRVAALALMLCLPFGAMATADQLDDALAAYNSWDFATALKLFRPLADQGHAEAQRSKIMCYVVDIMVPRG